MEILHFKPSLPSLPFFHFFVMGTKKRVIKYCRKIQSPRLIKRFAFVFLKGLASGFIGPLKNEYKRKSKED